MRNNLDSTYSLGCGMENEVFGGGIEEMVAFKEKKL